MVVFNCINYSFCGWKERGTTNWRTLPAKFRLGQNLDKARRQIFTCLLSAQVLLLHAASIYADEFDLAVCRAYPEHDDRVDCWNKLAEKPEMAVDDYAQAACSAEMSEAMITPYKWINDRSTQRYSQAFESDDTPGAIVLMGDAVLIQNTAGGWLRNKYACKYDTIGRTVVDLAFTPGRL